VGSAKLVDWQMIILIDRLPVRLLLFSINKKSSQLAAFNSFGRNMFIQ